MDNGEDCIGENNEHGTIRFYSLLVLHLFFLSLPFLFSLCFYIVRIDSWGFVYFLSLSVYTRHPRTRNYSS